MNHSLSRDLRTGLRADFGVCTPPASQLEVCSEQSQGHRGWMDCPDPSRATLTSHHTLPSCFSQQPPWQEELETRVPAVFQFSCSLAKTYTQGPHCPQWP